MSTGARYRSVLDKLITTFGEGEGFAIANLVREHVSGSRGLNTVLSARLLTPEQEDLFESLAARVLNQEPVQYVLGSAWFFDEMFEVNPAVLIPRPETEELVAWIIGDLAGNGKEIRMLDIGTGSGIIPITIKKKFPSMRVEALDKSSAALQVAERNAVKLGAQVDFLMTDFLDPSSAAPLPVYDLIVSNPPYISAAEQSSMPQNVTGFEPPMALFVPGEDPLLFYRLICDFAEGHLSREGSVYLEIHEDRAGETMQVFRDKNFQVSLRKDLQGKDRMLRVRR